MHIQRPDNYVISEITYFLKTMIVDDRNHTFVLDEYGAYNCPKSITRIIRSSCRTNGITIERMKVQSKRFFTDRVHKQPLTLAYDNNLPVVFFPIYSARNNNNVWINCNAIINISHDGDGTLITFPNFYQIKLPVQHQAFSNLYSRAQFLQKYLRKELPINKNLANNPLLDI